MKPTADYSDFEKLLQRKSFDELNDDERKVVQEFADEEEYKSMRRLITDGIPEIQSNMGTDSLPLGGSDEVWEKFIIQQQSSKKKTTKILGIFTQKVPAWVPAGIAAMFILAWFIIQPTNSSSSLAKNQNDAHIKQSSNNKTDTIIIEKNIPCVHRQDDQIASLPISQQHQKYSNSTYIPSVESVQQISTDKTGTNASEMGSLAQIMFVVN